MHDKTLVWAAFVALCGCSTSTGTGLGFGDENSASAGMGSTGTSGGSDGTETAADVSSGSDDDASGSDGSTPKLDVGSNDDPPSACEVGDELDAIGDCSDVGPPDSFSPSLEWSFDVDPELQTPLQSMVIPLVGNFTDDNGDDAIDLCDTPDVVLVADLFVGYALPCSIFLLDGATGTMHYKIPSSEGISCVATPAFADIDDDAQPELVTLYREGGVAGLKAFEADGSVKWATTDVGQNATDPFWVGAAVALHDLDADGDVEIVVGHTVFDHTGTLLWEQPIPDQPEGETSTAVDLDGDGQLEVVTGHAAYRHDGSVVFDLHPAVSSRSFPQIGDVDDDTKPEIVLTTEEGIVLVEHDGTLTFGPVRPTGVPVYDVATWMRPATIHDFDGDGLAEWASSSEEFYAVYEGPDPGDIVWQAMVADASGASAGTAFDFLGDGIAEAMYADEWELEIYDGQTGGSLLTQPRCSGTYTEYPVVADVDNDGSAEILVVSTICADNSPAKPALQVFGEAEDRWIQARRIWNQHAYYVTNVREDGTVPQQPVNNWEIFNTFRTNAQIDGGGLCVPQG